MKPRRVTRGMFSAKPNRIVISNNPSPVQPINAESIRRRGIALDKSLVGIQRFACRNYNVRVAVKVFPCELVREAEPAWIACGNRRKPVNVQVIGDFVMNRSRNRVIAGSDYRRSVNRNSDKLIGQTDDSVYQCS